MMPKEIPTKYSPHGMLDWPTGVERLSNGNTLIADAGYWSGTGSEIIEVDRLGQVVWRYGNDLLFAHSAKLSGNNTIIITDTGNERVLEVDKDGSIIWSSEEWGDGTGTLNDGSHLYYPNDAEEVSGGNILITDRNNNRIIEVDRKGDILWRFDKLKHPHDADRLPNGNTMVASSDENRVIELDPSGEIIWSYGNGDTNLLNWPRDADRLQNGNTLIADSKNNRILEVSPSGKIVWSFSLNYWGMPYESDRLPNGNTLIAIQQRRQIIEVDPAGNIVWGFRNYIQGHIRPYLENGNFEAEAYPGADLPAAWVRAPLLSEGGVNLFWDSEVYLNGTHSIGIEYDKPGTVWWQQTVQVKKGKLYKLSDNIKTQNLEGFAHTQAAFLDEQGGFTADILSLPTTRARDGTTDWSFDAIEIHVPENATAIDVRCLVSGKGKAWFDEIVFEELPWG